MNYPKKGMRLISIREACSLTSLSRTSLFLKSKSGDFPKMVSLSDSGYRKAFVAAEVEEWIQARIACRDNSEAA